MLGQRVLLICTKTVKTTELTAYNGSSSSDFESYVKEIKDLCVLGMVGIIDKPRDGISDIIKTCRQAGIRIFM